MPTAGNNARTALIETLNGALADHLALFVKTKNFHWHVAGPRFRDLHLLFDEQAQQILALVDVIGERVRKNGGETITSIGAVGKLTRIADEDDATLDAQAMVERLLADNRQLRERLEEVKAVSGEADDHATNGMVDDWIDQTEERIWFLSQSLK
ncbi:DNA starvation/stationary phase protection protein [Erythrobacteraceae bacterium CFH 75059]|uniref:Dps family protein n=1 Tax=Qipengyuania thermophila TaxID=2509361 RepID=UPI0010213EEF|nr:DNA starvation/stationary phase protection protein [Qipengyuania thermophila]TCD04840.1 DNA starvation/stationary phase protection protein [Erythrobacteraceae bacterium CFH 75059]